jgi:hypothetical protein
MRPSPAKATAPAMGVSACLVQRNFEHRKVSLGDCGRSYDTPCIHEHSCLRCPLLRPAPAQRPRLQAICQNLTAQPQNASSEKTNCVPAPTSTSSSAATPAPPTATRPARTAPPAPGQTVTPARGMRTGTGPAARATPARTAAVRQAGSVIPAGFAGKINLTVPATTLLDMADRPGEITGIGPVDPDPEANT